MCGMEDRGAPIAYLALRQGTPVCASGGEQVGTVAHVLADADADIFDGLVIDTEKGHRFVDASHVEALHERGVMLGLDAAGAARLPEPSENPAAVDAGAADFDEGPLAGKLRRAWDLISGRY
jgi:uncharacterized protein YrrD